MLSDAGWTDAGWTGPWAKITRDEAGTVTAALPLADHGFDVAAAFAALLAGGGWDRALTETAGRALTAQDYARLVALAALHDVGKANRGFQARAQRGRVKPVGHEGQVAALIYHRRLGETAAGRALREIHQAWGAGEHLAALMAHHGKPREEFRTTSMMWRSSWEPHVNEWSASEDAYDPIAEVDRLIADVRARFPLAFAPGPPLPQLPRFVALFAGLMTLADWLGSDASRFPVEGPHGAEREGLRTREAASVVAAEGLARLATPVADFVRTFGFPPRGVQEEAVALDLGLIALIEAETGSGKTEAALWRWLALRKAGAVDGIYFALPTRSAAVQLHARVVRMLTATWGDQVRAVLAVPGYLRVGWSEGEPLPGWEVRWDDARDDGRWAAERTNRFLAARVAVGTIDQALLGALQVKHAHLRAAALSRSLLVVDEVHASDAYMGALLRRLLENHVAAGGHALLLSATLGGTMRARLLGQPEPTLAEAEATPYPAMSGSAATPRMVAAAGTTKTVRIEVAPLIEDAGAIAALAIEAARDGASVLVVRNSVRGAVAVTQAVEALAPDLAFRVKEVATLHHGRFAPSDRRLLDCAVERAFGRGRTATGRVLVGTQTLEQSLDIDADLLLTDLAPMDVLLQRIGRLHRHARDDRGRFSTARAIVLRPAERDLSPLLGTIRERHGLGPMKDGGGVYPNLLHIEATLRMLEGDPAINIPADNRRLVEQALHPEVARKLTDDLGPVWQNHFNACDSIDFRDRQTGQDLSLDLGSRFSDLCFPTGEHIATRLGEQTLLVDFARPFAGPFGEPVERVAIPYWLAGGIGRDDTPHLLDADADGQRFAIGKRRFAYGRWGLMGIASD